MAPPLRVTLDQAAHDELDRRYQTAREATTRTRYQMILLRAEGHPVVEVAQLTRCSPDTVRRVLKRYLASGPDAVPHRPHPGQPPHSPPFVGAGVGPGRRPGPPRGGGRQCAVELSAAGRLPGRGDRPPGGDRDGPDRAAPRGVVGKRPRWVLHRKAQAQPGWANNA
jgi:hypothetical protein